MENGHPNLCPFPPLSERSSSQTHTIFKHQDPGHQEITGSNSVRAIFRQVEQMLKVTGKEAGILGECSIGTKHTRRGGHACLPDSCQLLFNAQPCS